MARALYAGSDITALDTNGDPAPGAKLYAYLTGTTTETPMYTAASGGTTHAYPLVADSAGRFPDVFLDVDISYRMVLTNSAGSDTIYDLDPVKEGVGTGYATYATLAGAGGADLIGSAQGDTVQEIIDGLYLGLFTDFAGTPPAIPLVQLRVQTSGYGSVGVGAAWYVYDGTVNGAYVAANPRISFLDSLGRGWKIDVNQRLTAEMLGAIANGSTDCSGVFTAWDTLIIRTDTNTAYTYLPDLHWGPGDYYMGVGQTVNRKRIGNCYGNGSGLQNNGATRWIFDADVPMLIINDYNTTMATTDAGTTTARGSIFDGITFRASSQGTAATAHGIWLRTSAVIRNCSSENFGGDGIRIVAQIGGGGSIEGNASEWRLESCLVNGAGKNGLHVGKVDANAGYCLGLIVKTVTGCGILDENTFGNTYIAPQITGYGNNGVTQGGGHYELIALSDVGTTPGTNGAIWNYVGAGSASASYPAWNSGTTYVPTRPICIIGDSNRSVVVTNYTEAVQRSHIQPPAMQIGGLSGSDNRSNSIGYDTSVFGTGAGPLLNPGGFGMYQSFLSGSAEYTLYGSYWASAVGPSPGYFWQSRSDNGNYHAWALRISNGDIIFDRSEYQTAFVITTSSTTRQFGRTAAVPFVFQPANFSMPNDEGTQRMMWSSGAVPSTGYHAQGEIVFRHNQTAGGKMGWVCVVAGTPGTWKEWGVIDA